MIFICPPYERSSLCSNFRALKNVQKALNDITRKVWLYLIRRTRETRALPRIFRLYEKKSLLKLSHPKKFLPNCPAQKNPGIENFETPKKSFDHSHHLKSGVPTAPFPPLPWALAHPSGFNTQSCFRWSNWFFRVLISVY